MHRRVAAVTGAASGIGYATARILAEEGVGIVAVDRDAELLEEARHELPGDTRLLVADVGDEAGAETTVRTALESFGRLDSLINAAGITFVGTVLDTTVDDWERIFRTNVRSVFLYSRAAIPALRLAGGGTIVNVASEAGLVGFPGYAAYAASKGAIVNLTRSMALDHAGDGVRVNCVCPGSIETPLLQRFYDSQPDPASARTADEATHPLGIGQPVDVAHAIAFLAGAASAYITGHALAVDGGYTCQ